MAGGMPRPITRRKKGLFGPDWLAQQLAPRAATLNRLPAAPQTAVPMRPARKTSAPPRTVAPPKITLPTVKLPKQAANWADIDKQQYIYDQNQRNYRRLFARTPQGKQVLAKANETAARSAYRAASDDKKKEFMRWAAQDGGKSSQGLGVLKETWVKEHGRGKPFDVNAARKLAKDEGNDLGIVGNVARWVGKNVLSPLGDSWANYNLQYNQGRLENALHAGMIPADKPGVAMPTDVRNALKKQIKDDGLSAGLTVLNESLRLMRGVEGAAIEPLRQAKKGDFMIGPNVAKGLYKGVVENDRSYGGGQLLNELGMPKGTVTGLLGFGLDVATDPLTYFTWGNASVLRGAARTGALRVMRNPNLQAHWAEQAARAEEQIAARTFAAQTDLDREIVRRVTGELPSKSEGAPFMRILEAFNPEAVAAQKTKLRYDKRLQAAAVNARQSEMELRALRPTGGSARFVRDAVGEKPLVGMAAKRAMEVSAARRARGATTGGSRPAWNFMGKPLNKETRNDPFGLQAKTFDEKVIAEMRNMRRKGVSPGLAAVLPPRVAATSDKLGTSQKQWDEAALLVRSYETKTPTRVGGGRTRVPSDTEYAAAKRITQRARPKPQATQPEQDTISFIKQREAEMKSRLDKIEKRLASSDVNNPLTTAQRRNLRKQARRTKQLIKERKYWDADGVARQLPDMPLFKKTADMSLAMQAGARGVSARAFATVRPNEYTGDEFQRAQQLLREKRAGQLRLERRLLEQARHSIDGIESSEDYQYFLRALETQSLEQEFARLPKSMQRVARSLYMDIGMHNFTERLVEARRKNPKIKQELDLIADDVKQRIHGPNREEAAAVSKTADSLVVNVKQSSDYDVYVGRGRDPRTGEVSKWGNPFKVSGSRTRDMAIQQYRDYLWTEIRNGRIDLEELAALSGKKLGCYCAPQRCHARVLVEAAAWAERELRVRKTIKSESDYILKDKNLTANEELLLAAHTSQNVSRLLEAIKTPDAEQFERLIKNPEWGLDSGQRQIARDLRRIDGEEFKAFERVARHSTAVKGADNIIDRILGVDEPAFRAAATSKTLKPAEELKVMLEKGPNVYEIEEAMRRLEVRGKSQSSTKGRVMETFAKDRGLLFMPEDAPIGFRPVWIPREAVSEVIAGGQGIIKKGALAGSTVRVDNLRKYLLPASGRGRGSAGVVEQLYKEFSKISAALGSQRALQIADEILGRRIMLEHPAWAGEMGNVNQLRYVLDSAFSMSRARGIDVGYLQSYAPHMQLAAKNEMARIAQLRWSLTRAARASKTSLGRRRLGNAFSLSQRERESIAKEMGGDAPFAVGMTPRLQLLSDIDPTRFGARTGEMNRMWWTESRKRFGTVVEQQREVDVNQLAESGNRFEGLSQDFPFVINTYLRDVSHAVADSDFTQRVLNEFGKSLNDIQRWKPPVGSIAATVRVRTLMTEHRDLQSARVVASDDLAKALSTLDRNSLVAGKVDESLRQSFADWSKHNQQLYELEDAMKRAGVRRERVGELEETAAQWARDLDNQVGTGFDTWVKSNPERANKTMTWLEAETSSRLDAVIAHATGSGDVTDPVQVALAGATRASQAIADIDRQLDELRYFHGFEPDGAPTEAALHDLIRRFDREQLADADYLSQHLLPKVDSAIKAIEDINKQVYSQIHKEFGVHSPAQLRALEIVDQLWTLGRRAEEGKAEVQANLPTYTVGADLSPEALARKDAMKDIAAHANDKGKVTVVITGSREGADPAQIETAFADLASRLDPGVKVEIVHGAARGIDTDAAKLAEDFGFDVVAVPADWKTHGKKAGFLRNEKMLDRDGVDAVFAFRNLDKSPGTDHAMAAAEKRGLRVLKWQPDPVSPVTPPVSDVFSGALPGRLPFRMSERTLDPEMKEVMDRLGVVPEAEYSTFVADYIANRAKLTRPMLWDKARDYSRGYILQAALKDPDVAERLAAITDALAHAVPGTKGWEPAFSPEVMRSIEPARKISSILASLRFAEEQFQDVFAQFGDVADMAFKLSLPMGSPGVDRAAIGGGLSPAFRGQYKDILEDLHSALIDGFILSPGEGRYYTPEQSKSFLSRVVGDKNAQLPKTTNRRLTEVRKRLGAVEAQLRGGQVGNKGQRTQYRLDVGVHGGHTMSYEYENVIQLKRLEMEAELGRSLTPQEAARITMSPAEFERFQAHSLGDSQKMLLVRNGRHEELTPQQMQGVLRSGPYLKVQQTKHTGTQQEINDARIEQRAAQGRLDKATAELNRALQQELENLLPNSPELKRAVDQAVRISTSQLETQLGRKMTPTETQRILNSAIEDLPQLTKQQEIADVHIFSRSAQERLFKLRSAQIEATLDLESAASNLDRVLRPNVKTELVPGYIARKRGASVPKNQDFEGKDLEVVHKGGLGGGQVYIMETHLYDHLLAEQERLVSRKQSRYHKYYNAWKWLVTVPNPGFWVRNFLGDTQNSMLSQGAASYIGNAQNAWRMARYASLLERRKALGLVGDIVVDPNAPKALQKRQQRALTLTSRMELIGNKRINLTGNAQVDMSKEKISSLLRLKFGVDPRWGSFTVGDLSRMALQDAVFNAGFVGNEIQRTMHKAGELYDPSLLKPRGRVKASSQYQAAERGLARVGRRVELASRTRENMVRGNTYLGGLRATGSRSFASEQATRFHFDYDNLSRGELFMRNNLMPFYLWNARNLQLWSKAMFERPGLMATYEAFRQEMAWGAGLPPDWQDKMSKQEQLAMPIPIKIGGKIYTVSAGATGLSINALAYTPAALAVAMAPGTPSTVGGALSVDKDWLLGLVSPFLKVPVEMSFNYSTFLHNQIAPDYRSTVPAPWFMSSMPKFIQEATHYSPRYFDKTGSTSGEPGWGAKWDYLFRQAPGWAAFLYKMSKAQIVAAGDRPRRFDYIAQATGIRANPWDPEVMEYKLMVRTRSEIMKQISAFNQTENSQGQQIAGRGVDARYDALLDLRNQLTELIEAFQKRQGYRINETSGSGGGGGRPGGSMGSGGGGFGSSSMGSGGGFGSSSMGN